MNDTPKSRIRKPAIEIHPCIEEAMYVVAEGFAREVRQAISGHHTMAAANSARKFYSSQRGPSVAPLTVIAVDHIEWVDA